MWSTTKWGLKWVTWFGLVVPKPNHMSDHNYALHCAQDCCNCCKMEPPTLIYTTKWRHGGLQMNSCKTNYKQACYWTHPNLEMYTIYGIKMCVNVQRHQWNISIIINNTFYGQQNSYNLTSLWPIIIIDNPIRSTVVQTPPPAPLLWVWWTEPVSQPPLPRLRWGGWRWEWGLDTRGKGRGGVGGGRGRSRSRRSKK